MLSQEDLYLRLKILFTQEPKPLFFYSCKINKTPWQTRCKEGLREWEGTWNKACGLGSAVNQKHGGDTYFLFRQREASESVRQSESTVIHMVLLCCFAWWIPLWYSQESEVNDSLTISTCQDLDDSSEGTGMLEASAYENMGEKATMGTWK